MPKRNCHHCGVQFEMPDANIGEDFPCPVCGKNIMVPPDEILYRKKIKLTVEAPVIDIWDAARIAAVAKQIIANTQTVIVGKEPQVTLTVAALFAEGHILFEDVPGVAKTMLSRAVAKSVGCSFKRIQCTPDLQPENVIGDYILDPTTGRPDIRFGPIFAQMVLVDEINRASPRTQAVMLEAMGEGTVSMDKTTYRLERPFMVMATQNPIEQEGTFRLPEAQMDRFLLRLSIGYPDAAEEKKMCERVQTQHPIDTLQAVSNAEQILKCQQGVREIKVPAELTEYIIRLVRATREHPALRLGASPRGSLGLFHMAQALAAIAGRDTIQLEDIRSVAEVVLGHRLLVRTEARKDYPDGCAVVREILAKQ